MFLQDAATGTRKVIASGPEDVGFARFSRDDKWISMEVTHRPKGGDDIAVMPAGGGPLQVVLKADQPSYVAGWLPDGARIRTRAGLNVTVDNVTVTVYIFTVAGNDPRYSIDELAELGGVSRRTVRFYIQEGLLPAPFGIGRGNHYGPEHLNALLRVRAQQEAGRTLDEIRRPARPRERPVTAPAVAAWRRIVLAPGVELHVSTDARLPNATALRTLADWSRAYLGRSNEEHDAE